MITSPQNEKLKLVRKLERRRAREKQAAFVTEGEDLLEAGRAAGCEPEFVLCAAGSGLGGEEVEPELLASVSSLGSGTRAIAVWAMPPSEEVSGPVTTYLEGVADPGNVGAIIRSADALVEGSVVLGPGCADPYSPKAVRASMGSIHSVPIAFAGLEATAPPRVGLVAHGGDALAELEPPLTLCLGAEREGLPAAVAERCERTITIGLRAGGAESLNVAAAAAIALQRISSGWAP